MAPMVFFHALDAAGLSCLVYEICTNVPEEGDFLATMRRNLAALESASAPRVLAERESRRDGLPSRESEIDALHDLRGTLEDLRQAGIAPEP